MTRRPGGSFARRGIVVVAAVLAPLAGCVARPDPARLDRVAEAYVRLALALGRHDAGEVDAYHGPPEWKAAADSAAPMPLATLAARADSLAGEAGRVRLGRTDELVRMRQRFLVRQLRAVGARARTIAGAKLSFDEESRLLYDVEAPPLADSTLDRVLAELDRRLPGAGPLAERWASWQARFAIPPERVDTVFRAALAECRARTLRHVALPDDERFTIEYVKDQPWGGYNWYQGRHRSLIQVNVGLPIYIDRAIDLAAHEGYPGHHVYNTLLERELVEMRGWVEYSIYPLFAPQSLMAEGTAEYGTEVAFEREERIAFERDVLYPLAGLDTALARPYREIARLMQPLEGVQAEAARRYLDGRMSRDSTITWLMRYKLWARDRAERSVQFAERYRSYVVNYTLGFERVKAWVERQAGPDPEERWQVYGRLLASPRLPGDLRARPPRR